MMRKRRSLVERTTDKLRERIRSGYKPGDCLPAIRELCETMGVSLNTLRAAQVLLDREGLVDIRHGEGVFVRAPARQPRIGVLSELNLLRPACAYHRNLADETLLLLRERGMTPHLFCGTVPPGQSPEEPTCPEFWEAAEQRRLDGAIILNFPANESWLLRLRETTLPLVADYTPYAVHHADVRMVEAGVQALARHGARRIALLATSTTDVRQIFEQTLRDMGMTTEPRWIMGEFDPALPGAGWEQFRQIWRAAVEKPDGILIVNDLLFNSAAHAIRELRIDVPGQLRVVTHAQREAAPSPAPFPHTRIEFDPRDFARAFVDLLELRLAGKPPPHTPPRVPYRVVEKDREPKPVRVVRDAAVTGNGGNWRDG